MCKGHEKLIGFVIGVHDRIDDMDAHIDIMSFYPESQVIVVCSNQNVPQEYLSRWSNLVMIDNYGFSIGPLMAFSKGLKKAHEMGLKWIVYRNADDWMFNHDMVRARIDHMDNNDLNCGAYNWLSTNTMNEFAMNEVTARVDCFMKDRERMERYFLDSSPNTLCENKFGKWVRSVDKFYRLPGRERFPGIGHESKDIIQHLACLGKTPGPLFLKKLEKNNRYFCMDWQLIGSHDNAERGHYYNLIKHNIPYHKELEEKNQFARWLDAWRTGSLWNPTIEKRIKTNTKVKSVKSFKCQHF